MPPLDEPPPLPSPKRRAGCATWLLRLFAVGVALVVAASATMLFLMRSGRAPDSRILDRHELHERIVDRLRALELQEGEEIVLFYSSAVFDVAFDGNLLTDRRVVSWFQSEDEERAVDSVDLGAIDTIMVRFTSHVFEDTTLESLVARYTSQSADFDERSRLAAIFWHIEKLPKSLRHQACL